MTSELLHLDMVEKELIVTKAGGDQVLFSEEKLRSSMRNAGASADVIDAVLEEVLPKLYPGISTKKIYRWAFDKLKNRSRNIASKYKLKSAIMELGPDGFIFEKFVSAILKSQGYHTKTGVIVKGKCITHEIDVLAKNDKEQILVECKYHSQPGKVSDVKVPLYIRSRFEDVKAVWDKESELNGKQFRCKVVTNTRFSPDAEKYAHCSGLDLLGWDYPRQKGIKDLIDELKLYPITCLTNLSRSEKDQLMAQGIILCNDLLAHPEKLDELGYSFSRQKKILEETKNLLFS